MQTVRTHLVGPDLDLNRVFQSDGIPDRIFGKVDFEERNQQTKNSAQNYPEGKVIRRSLII